MKKIIYLVPFALLLFGSIQGKAQVITTIAGQDSFGYSGDGGPAGMARMNEPMVVVRDNSGNIYVGDYGNSVVRKITRDGIISTYAGTGTSGYSGDGGAATAADLGPTSGMALDADGNLYITDIYDNVVRKVTPSGIISTVAGSGFTSSLSIGGYSGDGGPATSAEMAYPFGIAVDDSGNLYIADTYNQVIRKVNTSGIISTFAGDGYGAGLATGGGYSGDGGAATSAELNFPTGVAADHSGNVYIADGNNRVIRKVDASGIITTYAGIAGGGYSGDGGPASAARLGNPFGLSFDTYGNLYITDQYDNVIRKIDTSRIITTVAGNAAGLGVDNGGYSGDDGPADSALLNGPMSVAADAIGNLFIADGYNNVIREVSGIGGINHICTGDATPFTAQVAGGTWSSLSTAIASVSASGEVTGVSAGTTFIYYATGTDTAAVAVYVTAVPDAGTITDANAAVGADTICSGTTTALSGMLPGGIWHIANNYGVIYGTNTASIAYATETSSVRDTFNYSMTYTCGTATSQFILTGVNPNPGTVTGTDTVCPGNIITFTDSASGGTWSLMDTTLATLEGSGIVKGIVPGIDFIFYTVTGPYNGCNSQSYMEVVIDSPSVCRTTGVTATGLNNDEVKVYPNPSFGSFTLSIPATGEATTITVTDLMGRVVENTWVAANTDNVEIDLHTVPGTYMIKVQNSNSSVVQKIVVE